MATRPARSLSIFSAMLAMFLITFSCVAFCTEDELESLSLEIRIWLATSIIVPDDTAAFSDVLRKAVEAGPVDYRQAVNDALHWIGYAHLRFDNDSKKVPNDIFSYSDDQIMTVGIQMAHDEARKLTKFSLWDIFYLAEMLMGQMTELFNSWQEFVEQ
jgi:hypothetical protein